MLIHYLKKMLSKRLAPLIKNRNRVIFYDETYVVYIHTFNAKQN